MVGHHSREDWSIIFATTIDTLWMRRNKIVFEDSRLTTSTCVSLIRGRVVAIQESLRMIDMISVEENNSRGCVEYPCKTCNFGNSIFQSHTTFFHRFVLFYRAFLQTLIFSHTLTLSTVKIKNPKIPHFRGSSQFHLTDTVVILRWLELSIKNTGFYVYLCWLNKSVFERRCIIK
ncbi:hypothetical protein RIF29_10084 [Crotalaria pallida]|uniref:Uncharacterized protein n=1 Tax=Crotalaria pallida TaxID=3830 RepID=A0AAN9ILQ1_CROPI